MQTKMSTAKTSGPAAEKASSGKLIYSKPKKQKADSKAKAISEKLYSSIVDSNLDQLKHFTAEQVISARLSDVILKVIASI